MIARHFLVSVLALLALAALPFRGFAAGLPVALPATGQTAVYATGDDGTLKKGLAWPSPRFTAATDTVDDALTGLTWLKNANPTAGTKTWQQALDYVAGLNGSAYLGYSDWRLPNVKELASLVDASRVSPALASGHPFTGVANSAYWSSSTYEADRSQAWYLDVNTGNLNVTAKSGALYLMVVRGGVSSYAGTDSTLPQILSFALPATWSGLTVPVSDLTTLDNSMTTGFWLSESATPPAAAAAGWLEYRPNRYTFAAAGTKTLYAFVKDAAGNVSAPVSAVVEVTSSPVANDFVRGALPKSGQTSVYAAGDDGSLQKGIPWPMPRFIDVSVETAEDALTGLTWLKNANPTAGTKTWQQALDYVAGLNGSAYLGYSDWRLPNLTELASLADVSHVSPALATAHPFAGVVNSSYWTSTSYQADRSQAWYLDMNTGNLNVTAKSGALYLMVVRGGVTPEGADTVAPRILAFSLPAAWNSLTVPVRELSVFDDRSVSAYWLSENADAPKAGDSGWLEYRPVRYSFATTGGKTLYAYVKDAAGNISAVASAAVEVSADAIVYDFPRGENPATGQLNSYATGDDGGLLKGASWPVPRFVNESVETVEDALTGLTWLKNANVIPVYDATFDKDGTANDGVVTWQHALDFVTRLNSDAYLGYSDWRLPNVKELGSLVDVNRTGPALSFGHPFASVANSSYWTSTSYRGDLSQAWYLDVNTGNLNVTAKSGALYLMVVRGGVTSFAADDSTAPRIISFSLPAAHDGLTVPLTEFSVVDDRLVTGYWLSEAAEAPAADAAGWLEYQPTRFTFGAAGANTLHAWVKDAAGHVSAGKSAGVTVTADSGYRGIIRDDLPKTGQVTSYAAGDDGALAKGAVWPLPRFVGETFDLAEDGLTGLVWLRDFNLMPAYDAAYDKDGTANDGIVTWQHALDFIARLNTDKYLGYGDWRLPSVKELGSLVDVTRTGPALPFGFPFRNVANAAYWSSSTYAGDTTQAWYLDANTGNINVTPKTNSTGCYLVPVRGGVANYAGTDTIAPQILGFALPTSWDGLNVPLTDMSALDNVKVTGWWLSESPAVPAAAAGGWLAAAPRSYVFSSAGDKSLYAFVKDAAGNVSAPASATTVLTAQSATLPTQNVLQQTGQTLCYDTAGTVLSSCDGTGQDGMERVGTLPSTARFTKRTGYITDSFTGLTWVNDGNQLKTINAAFDTDGTAGDGRVTWQHALDFVASLNTLNGVGYRNFTDWRLPNINDLRYLADYSKAGNLRKSLEDAGITSGLAGDWYWSSTSYGPDPKKAWVFSMNDGQLSNADKATANYYLIAVRGGGSPSAITYTDTDQKSCYDSLGASISCVGTGQDGAFAIGQQVPSPRYDISMGLVFKDALTGLVWSREANPLRYYEPSFDTDGTAGDGYVTWQHALDYVKKANTDKYLGYSDWRLPNIAELDSLVSRAAVSVSMGVSGSGFYLVEPVRYWSSTSYDGSNAWFVDFSSGQESYEGKGAQHPLMLVRSGAGASVASLTVYRGGTGSGLVSGDSGRITCGGDCFESYTTLGGTVTLTAVPEAGSTFTGWSGDCSGTGDCTLTLMGDLFATASFSRAAAAIQPVDSGQRTCYDVSNNAVACSAGTALVADASAISGPQLAYDRFHDNGDGSVTDRLNGLMIPKDLNLLRSYAPAIDTDGSLDGAVTWQHALDFVEKLNADKYLGYGDWRLPNVREMFSFGDYSARSALYTWNSMGLLYNHQEAWYWTSTTQESSRNSAWLYAPNSGSTTTTGKGGQYYVLPVRGGSGIARTIRTGQTACSDSAGTLIACTGTGQDADTRRGELWPTPRFTVDMDTLTDQATGLVWPIDGNLMMSLYNSDSSYFDTDGGRDGAVSWQKAAQFIGRLNSDQLFGFSDWRLPTVTELETLVHYGTSDSSLWLKNSGAWFLNLASANFWSSTTYSVTPSQAWSISLAGGGVGAPAKTSQYYVLPVRGGNGFGAASLTVVTAGGGSVASQQGGGIDCGSSCYAAYPAAGTSVTLTATPAGGSDFLGWAGGGCSGSGACTVSVQGAMTVVAQFAPTGSALTKVEVPQTTQSLCYDASGSTASTVACAGSGQDAEKRAGAGWPYPRFELNGAGTAITDKLTGLMYPRAANSVAAVNAAFDADGTAADGAVTWQHALDFVNQLNSSAYLGYADWRLPNINELKSLVVNRDKSDAAAWLNSAEAGFSGVQGAYWSSTTSVANKAQAWYATLQYGTSDVNAKSAAWYVIPVRTAGGGRITLPATGQVGCWDAGGTPVACPGSGQDGATRAGTALPEVRFSLKPDGTMADLFTGLVWSSNGASAGPAGCANAGAAMTWSQALTFVACLNTNSWLGRADWRLPNQNELSSLMQFGMGDISLWLGQNGFSGVSGNYWSSTSNLTNAANAVYVGSTSGLVSYTAKGGKLPVLPVAGGTLGTAGSLHVFKTGSGSGSITSSPAAISCGSDCDELFASSGSQLTLTATADAGSTFLGWLGACSGTSSTCSVTVNGDVNVTARFAKNYTISVVRSGNGNGSVSSVPAGISCGSSCGASFADTTTVTLTATADSGYFLDRFEGCTSASGNTCSVTVAGASAVTAYFYAKPLTSTSLILSSETILNGATIDLAGKLTPQPDSGQNLSGLSLTIRSSAPDGSFKDSIVSTDSTGHFSLQGLSGFTQKGNYTVKVSFYGNDRLSASASPAMNVLVGASAGYAIIVQGKIASGEGLASHNKTTNRIYRAMRSRGFDDANIMYFNYTTGQSAAGITVDNTPTKGNIQAAFDALATKMNGSPAPLYVIMVNHGEPGKFHLDSDFISPAELKAWLAGLESKLNAAALLEKRVVIDGSCYSGSFIPVLSGAGRIVIASAAADEESYKGSMEPDGIRSGEFFLDALFDQLKRGVNLKDAFIDASAKTRTYTRRGGLSSNSLTYGDSSVQHPLFDDNGDGKGSNSLASNAGDGLDSAAFYLGVGQSITNAASSPADIISTPPTQFLDAVTPSAQIWLTTTDVARTQNAWVEIRTPSSALSGASGNLLQVDPQLTRVVMTYDTQGGRWQPLSPYTFSEVGMYELFYYTTDTATSEITPVVRAVVFRSKAGNSAPGTVALLAPSAGDTVKTSGIFTWNPVVDGNGDPVTYTLEISNDSSFSTLAFKAEEITFGGAAVPEGFLKDAVSNYYWRVKAVDQYGAVSVSESRQFSTDNTNGLLGLILGTVNSDTNGAIIPGATVTVGSGTPMTAYDNGKFIAMAPPGTVSVKASANGYAEKTVTVTAVAGKTVRPVIFLAAAAPTPVNGACGSSNGTTVAVAPSASLCSAGTASPVTGSGPWGWSCAGTNGGTTASCSAARTVPVATKAGDCDGDNTVTIAEVQSAINMFLGLKAVAVCVDTDSNGSVSIAEVQKTINSFLGL